MSLKLLSGHKLRAIRAPFYGRKFVDKVAPSVIGLTVTDIGHNSARVKFSVDEASRFFWWVEDREASFAKIIDATEDKTDLDAGSEASFLISPLTVDRDLRFKVAIYDRRGNVRIANFDFSTTAAPVAGGTNPVITDFSIGSVSHNSVTVNWNTNKSGPYSILVYNPETSDAIDNIIGNSTVGDVSIVVTGLVASKDYDMVLTQSDTATPANKTTVSGSVTTKPAPAAGNNKLVMGGVTFTRSQGATQSGRAPCGAYWMVVGDGDTITNSQDVIALTGTHSTGGFQKNPIRTISAWDVQGNEPQGYDTRGINYQSTSRLGKTFTVKPGDIVVGVVPLLPEVPFAERRDGVESDWLTIHFVAEAPNSTHWAPAAVGWTGRGVPQWYSHSIETFVDSITLRSTTGMSKKTPAEIISVLEKPYPVYISQLANTTNAQSGSYPGGYEVTAPRRPGPVAMYGEDIGKWYSEAACTLQDSSCSRADRIKIATYLVRDGRDIAETFLKGNFRLRANGGHMGPSVSIPTLAFLKWAGRTSEVQNLKSTIPGNLLDQVFTWTSGLISQLSIGTGATKPHISQLRRVLAVNGTTRVALEILAKEPAHWGFDNLNIVSSTGTVLTKMTGYNTGETGSTSVSATVLIEGVRAKWVNVVSNASLVIGNQVAVRDPIQPVAGDIGWIVDRSQEDPINMLPYSSSAETRYMGAQAYAGPVMFARALFGAESVFDEIVKHTENIMLQNYPSATNDWFGGVSRSPISTFVEEFWTEHWAEIKAGTSSIPGSFTDGMFTVTANNGGATVNVSSVPTGGGVIQYLLNGGNPIDTSLSAPGQFSLSGLTNGTIRTILLRLRNGTAYGGYNPTAKSFTPTAPSSGVHRGASMNAQSEVERILQVAGSLSDGGSPKPTLTASNRVKVHYAKTGDEVSPATTREIVSKWLVTTDTTISGPLIAFANMLIALGGPSDTWEIVWHTREGRGYVAALSDADTVGSATYWSFNEHKALAAAFTASFGGAPNRHYISWNSANRSMGLAFARITHELFTGKRTDGSTISVPFNVMPNSGTTPLFVVDHLFTELYGAPSDNSVTLGMHLFDIRADNTNAKTLAVAGTNGSYTDSTGDNIEKNRLSVIEYFKTNPGKLRRGDDIMSYQNGYASTTGAWTDVAHPGAKHPDGMIRFAAFLGRAVARSFGLGSAQPEFDTVIWGRDYVTLRSSAGSVNDLFGIRGITRPANRTAQWVEINGVPATRVDYVDGDCRVYFGNGTQKFIPTDTIQIMPGGGSGLLSYQSDHVDNIWMARPHVATTEGDLDALPIRPIPDFMTRFPNTLTNTSRT